MVDIATLKYRVIVVNNKGKKYNITDFVENLGWDENDGEISQRITFQARNDKTAKGYISTLCKLGNLIYVSAKDGKKKYKEVARGSVITWEPSNQNSSHDVKCTCYDNLYNLQKSQDNFFFRSGTGTKARINKVLKRWKIKLGTYKGPTQKHGKKRYQAKYLSDILLDILDDAVKKGGKKSILRMEKNKVAVLPYGSNDDIYVFTSANTKIVSKSWSTADLVTRVKVIGKSKKSDKNKVVATLNGLTKYGIRQRIYTRGSDETLKAAKKAGQEILDESGDVDKSVTVQAPDVPYIRKGDIVYLKIGSNKGYFNVKGIQHDADTCSMTMDLEPADKSSVSNNKKTMSADYKVGDVVTFKGGKHYVSSTSSKGYSAKAGKAKITKKNTSGKHPYHLIHTNSKSNVYGWVDSGTFS